MKPQIIHLSDHCHINAKTDDQKSVSGYNLQVALPQFILNLSLNLIPFQASGRVVVAPQIKNQYIHVNITQQMAAQRNSSQTLQQK